MRCYHLSNMYLSSIQHGIQSAHAQMELFVKYHRNSNISNKGKILYDWAEHHKTMIVLNGGYLSIMQEALAFLDSEDNPYPWSAFYESEEAMGGMLTNIVIVLPEKIYETSALIRSRKITSELIVMDSETDEVEDQLISYGTFSAFEIELCNRLNKFGLAS